MKFRIMKYAVQWDIQHTLVLLGTTIGGAITAFLTSQPSLPMFEALLSFQWKQEQPFVYGAIYASLAALLALAKQTFLTTPPTVTELPGPMFRAPAKPPGPPTAARRTLLTVRSLAMFVPVGLLAFVLSCTAAQQATWTRVEQVVFDDLAQGKSRQQIEVDVGTVLAGQVGADIARIVDEAIVLLLDTGAIPPNVIPIAQQRLAEHHKVTP